MIFRKPCNRLKPYLKMTFEISSKFNSNRLWANLLWNVNSYQFEKCDTWNKVLLQTYFISFWKPIPYISFYLSQRSYKYIYCLLILCRRFHVNTKQTTQCCGTGCVHRADLLSQGLRAANNAPPPTSPDHIVTTYSFFIRKENNYLKNIYLKLFLPLLVIFICSPLWNVYIKKFTWLIAWT